MSETPHVDETLEIAIPIPICTYVLQTGRRKGIRCSQPVSRKCVLGCYCSAHYRIRSKKVDSVNVEKQPGAKYTLELLNIFQERWEREEEERMYRAWKKETGRDLTSPIGHHE